jgi:hypothetical protein
VFPVRYELGFYIPEEGVLHSHCRVYLILHGLILSCIMCICRYLVFTSSNGSKIGLQTTIYAPFVCDSHISILFVYFCSMFICLYFFSTIHKSWHWVSSTSGSRSVGIVRSRTRGHGVCVFLRLSLYQLYSHMHVLYLIVISVF